MAFTLIDFPHAEPPPFYSERWVFSETFLKILSEEDLIMYLPTVRNFQPERLFLVNLENSILYSSFARE